MSEAEFVTVPFLSEHARSGFECGKAALDEFFSKYAGQNQRRGLGRTWVLERPSERKDLPPVLGFYTLAPSSLERDDLSADDAKRLPRYPIPIVLIARLARDGRAGGMRVGERLLVDAQRRALAIDAHGGALGVVVDGKDGGAESSYARYGYETLPGETSWPRRMYLPMETLRESVAPGTAIAR